MKKLIAAVLILISIAFPTYGSACVIAWLAYDHHGEHHGQH